MKTKGRRQSDRVIDARVPGSRGYKAQESHQGSINTVRKSPYSVDNTPIARATRVADEVGALIRNRGASRPDYQRDLGAPKQRLNTKKSRLKRNG